MGREKAEEGPGKHQSRAGLGCCETPKFRHKLWEEKEEWPAD